MVNVAQVGGRRLGCFLHIVAARCVPDWGSQDPSAKPAHGVLQADISYQRAGDLRPRFQPGLFAQEGAGNRSSIVYAVSMIFRGQPDSPAYRFHRHQTYKMLCRYRIDAVFSSFLSAHSEEKWIVLLPCGSPTDGAPYPGSLIPGVRLGRAPSCSIAI